jgi:hypothetical protein
MYKIECIGDVLFFSFVNIFEQTQEQVLAPNLAQFNVGNLQDF